MASTMHQPSKSTTSPASASTSINPQDVFRALEASASILPKSFMSPLSQSEKSSSSHIEFAEHPYQYQNPPPPPPSPVSFPSGSGRY